MTLHQLQTDVLKRLGEIPGPLSSFPTPNVPDPEDIIALKIETLLPEIGARLLREATPEMLGSGIPIAAEATARRMPCGLYAAEVPLPDDFVRLTAVRLVGWERGIGQVIMPGDAGWECQWSPEPGIAGSPSRPRAYLDAGVLRLIGTEEAPALVSLRGWCLPKGPEFEFPEPLYPDLVKELSILYLY